MAQGLARFLDMEEVTGSIPVSPTFLTQPTKVCHIEAAKLQSKTDRNTGLYKRILVKHTTSYPGRRVARMNARSEGAVLEPA